VTVIWIASIGLALLAIVDGMRRPESEWLAADRDRAWWMGIIGMLGLCGLGILGLVAYGAGVLPRLGRATGQRSDDAFRKRDGR
jgi:hypothetical protein